MADIPIMESNLDIFYQFNQLSNKKWFEFVITIKYTINYAIMQIILELYLRPTRLTRDRAVLLISSLSFSVIVNMVIYSYLFSLCKTPQNDGRDKEAINRKSSSIGPTKSQNGNVSHLVL